jgi:hypothetical protein
MAKALLLTVIGESSALSFSADSEFTAHSMFARTRIVLLVECGSACGYPPVKDSDRNITSTWLTQT